MTTSEEIRAGKRCRSCTKEIRLQTDVGARFKSGRVLCFECDEHERDEKRRDDCEA